MHTHLIGGFMIRRALLPTVAILFVAATTAVAAVTAPAHAKWPPWLSIESPVNPYDADARGALFLIHGMVREGTPTLANLSGSAEGLVGGVRRSITLHFDATSHPGVFAVRKQWPSEGAWVLRVTLLSTSALVSIDRAGGVAGVRIPTQLSSGIQIPRAILAREIDSTLAEASKR
jgi:hypothetical protein